MTRPPALQWVAAIDAYGGITGPEPSDAIEGSDQYTSDAGLVCRGSGVTPDDAVEAARARWRQRLPKVRELLWDLQRAAQGGLDVEDQELVAQLRLLTGADPSPERRSSIPAETLPSWVALVQEIVRAQADGEAL